MREFIIYGLNSPQITSKKNAEARLRFNIFQEISSEDDDGELEKDALGNLEQE